MDFRDALVQDMFISTGGPVYGWYSRRAVVTPPKEIVPSQSGLCVLQDTVHGVLFGYVFSVTFFEFDTQTKHGVDPPPGMRLPRLY